MKRLIILFIALVFFLPAQSQELKTRRIKKIAVESGAYFPEFGSNSKEILFTGQNYKGLSYYNIRTRKTIQIKDKNARVSSFHQNDKNTVVYTLQSGNGASRELSTNSFDLDKKSVTILETSSNNGLEVGVDGKNIILKNNSQKLKSLSPSDDTYYVWASLSPDKSRILYTSVGKGTFVCDLDGNILCELGSLNAPTWINNEWVLGMDDQDDGYVTTKSDVYAFHLESGSKHEISKDFDDIALYPKASGDAKRIVFHNLKGDVFVAKIKIKN